MRNSFFAAFALAAAGVTLIQPGCGGEPRDGNVSAGAGADAPRGAKEKSGGPPRGVRIYAEDAQLSEGAHVTLSIRGIGQLLVSCDHDRTASVTFKADRLLATADVVVASVGGDTAEGTVNPRETFSGPPMSSPEVQVWSIAEFAAADVRPTMITVASRAVDHGGTPYRCAVAAQATVGSPTGTMTR